MIRSALFWIVALVVGAALALATGITTLANNLSFYYGFPLGWRLAYCPIVQPFECSLYNWLALFLDTLFFTAIGYVMIAILYPVLEHLRDRRSRMSHEQL